MSDTKPKKRRVVRRAVRPVDVSRQGLAWTHFERITSSRMRLRPEFSRTYYALCHFFADEFDSQRVSMKAGAPVISDEAWGQSLFLKHAASAMRSIAERLLKSFRLTDVAEAERYSLEMWDAAVKRLNRKGELALPMISSPEPGPS